MTALTLPGISIRLIQRIVCDRFKLSLDVMESPSRVYDHAHPRQIAMRLSREFTGKSLTTIGRYFGRRDHTTVIHAIHAVERRGQRSADARRAYAELRAALEMIAPRPAVLDVAALLDELGLGNGATAAEIDRAYRDRAKSAHPDQGGSRAEWDQLRHAYEQVKRTVAA